MTTLVIVVLSALCSSIVSYLMMNVCVKAVDKMTTNYLIEIQDITNEYLDELRKKAK